MFRLWKRSVVHLPSEFISDYQIIAELNNMATTYNSIDRKSFMERFDYFWACHQRICYLLEIGKVLLYAGECEFPYLKSIIENDGPEYSAIVIICAGASDFYAVGVCVRGCPLLKKISIHRRNVQKILHSDGIKVGT